MNANNIRTSMHLTCTLSCHLQCYVCLCVFGHRMTLSTHNDLRLAQLKGLRQQVLQICIAVVLTSLAMSSSITMCASLYFNLAEILHPYLHMLWIQQSKKKIKILKLPYSISSLWIICLSLEIAVRSYNYYLGWSTVAPSALRRKQVLQATIALKLYSSLNGNHIYALGWKHCHNTALRRYWTIFHCGPNIHYS